MIKIPFVVVYPELFLMFKTNLSEGAKKRINILKKTNDGFLISEEDMKMRGFGDLLGFKQSGMQSFRLADPVLHEDLFFLAENVSGILHKKHYKSINFIKY